MRRRSSLWVSGLVATALLATCKGTTEPSTTTSQAPFITAKRAWRPGERDSLIAQIESTHVWSAPFIGDISDLAPQIYGDTDSVVVIIRNAAVPISQWKWKGLMSEIQADTPPSFDSTWSVNAFDIRTIDQTQTPTDTILDVLGTMWSKVGAQTYHGFIMADRCHSSGGALRGQCMAGRFPYTKGKGYVPVNTASFSAASDTLGAGGGEYRQSDGSYWEANGGTFEIVNSIYPSASSTTVTSGPYTGGTSAAGTAFGQINNVTMPKVLPTAGTGFTVYLDFRSVAVPIVRLTCVFRAGTCHAS